jgi:hypothetical protein
MNIDRSFRMVVPTWSIQTVVSEGRWIKLRDFIASVDGTFPWVHLVECTQVKKKLYNFWRCEYYLWLKVEYEYIPDEAAWHEFQSLLGQVCSFQLPLDASTLRLLLLFMKKNPDYATWQNHRWIDIITLNVQRGYMRFDFYPQKIDPKAQKWNELQGIFGLKIGAEVKPEQPKRTCSTCGAEVTGISETECPVCEATLPPWPIPQ